MWRAPFSSNWSIDMSDLLPGSSGSRVGTRASHAGFRRTPNQPSSPNPGANSTRSWPTSGAREDDESLGRSGHRDIAVDRSFDARAERLWVDQDDQVELEPPRQLRGQRPDAGRRRPERGLADDAGDPRGMRGEPRVD